MQSGDLADGQLAEVLRVLGASGATGGLHVRRRDDDGDQAAPGLAGAGMPPRSDSASEAVLYLREGRLCAATASGPRPLLGVRLVAAGAVTREALQEALESQAGELAGWRLGELLVHLGYVDADIVVEFVVEQILDTVSEVSSWAAGSWRFRQGEKTRESDGLALDIDDVLGQLVERRLSWRDLEEYAGGAHAIPVQVTADEELNDEHIPLARTLLTEIDGRRTLAELATRCGLTTYEAGYVLAQLIESGAVVLQDDRVPVPPTAVGLPTDGSGPVGASVEDIEADPDITALFLDSTADDGDLGTQLAVLARQAEEARWTAEARRHEEIAARRRAAATAADALAAAATAQAAQASQSAHASQSTQAETVSPPAAGSPVFDLEPIGLAPLGSISDEPLAVDLGIETAVELPDTEQALREAIAGFAGQHLDTGDSAETLAGPDVVSLTPVTWDTEAATPSDEAHHLGAESLPEHRQPATAIGDPNEFVPTVPPEDDRAAIHAALAEVAAGFTETFEPTGTSDQLPSELSGALPAQGGAGLDDEPAWALAMTAPAAIDSGIDFTPDTGDRAPMTDTAALLRELSFLGLDDIPAPPPVAPRAPVAPRTPPPTAKTKRKSIFGR